MRLLLLVLAVGVLGACTPPFCNGNHCDCPSGDTCDFSGGCNAGTQSCNFNCESGATCTGTCGPDCDVQCMGTSCTHQVGAGSRVQCTSGNCFITCTGTCIVQGSANLTCVNGTTKGAAGCE